MDREKIWEQKGLENEEKWGRQSMPVLLLAIAEEFGELVQAYLECIFEGESPDELQDELDDMMALGYQVQWRMESEINEPDLPRCGHCGFKIDWHYQDFVMDPDFGIVHVACPIE